MATTTVTNLAGDTERVSLPRALEDSTCKRYSTGIELSAIYRGPRTGRMFAEFYSIWDNGRGECRGTYVREITTPEFIEMCDRCGIEPVGAEHSEV